MKVLFMVDSLVSMGEDELYVINSANMLKNYLYDVTIYTDAISEDLKYLLHGIKLVTGLSVRNNNKIIKEEFHIVNSFVGRNLIDANNITIKSNSRLFVLASEKSQFKLGTTLEYINTATNVVFTSPYAQEKHISIGMDRAVVIHNPVDINQYKAKDKRNVDKNITYQYKHLTTIVLYGQLIADDLLDMLQELSYLVKGLNVILLGKSNNKPTYENSKWEHMTVTNVGEVVNPQDYLNFADMVIASKREAVESIYCEKLVYVIDNNGVKGLIDMKNAYDYLLTDKGYRHVDTRESLNEMYNGLTLNYQSEYKKLRNYLREIFKEKILKDLY